MVGMHPVDANAHRLSQYTGHAGKYDFSFLHFSVPLSSVGSFATTNNMSINVYGVDDDKKMDYPLCVSSTLVPDRHVDLQLIERNGIQHYTTVRNFSRLVSRQTNNHGHAGYCFKQRLHSYSTQELLDAHATDCCHAQRTKFPNDPRCRFTNIQKQLPAPFVVYADFESILKPVDTDVDTTQGVEVGGESSSHVFQEHIPCNFAYQVVSSVDPNFSRPLVMYRGEHAAEKFVCDLQLEAKQLFDEDIAAPKPMMVTATELRSFKNATTCHICTKPLGDDKVRDHCHIAGSYRGNAHNECNPMCRISKSDWKLHVVIHNLKGYGGHLIVKALKSEFGEVQVIPQNMEKYKYLSLSGYPCSDSEYTHATRVWTAFGCKTMADYHDIYLQLDGLLRADFFEKFRTTCLEYNSVFWKTQENLRNRVSVELITDARISRKRATPLLID